MVFFDLMGVLGLLGLLSLLSLLSLLRRAVGGHPEEDAIYRVATGGCGEERLIGPISLISPIDRITGFL